MSQLRAAGYAPVAVPLIGIAPPTDPEPLLAAASRLFAGGFGWVAFTSVPAVQAILAMATTLGLLAPVPPGTAVAAVGPGTAGALTAAGIRVDLIPGSGGSAAALLDAWPLGRGTVFLPRSEIAGDELPEGLRDRGYDVSAVTAYRTVERAIPPAVAAELAEGGFAAVLLTSGSAARSLARVPSGVRAAVVAIGPSTARAATAAGLHVAAVAEHPTAEGLVAAVRSTLDVTGWAADRRSAVSSTPGHPGVEAMDTP